MQLDLNRSFKVRELEVRFKPRAKPAFVNVSRPEDIHQFLKPYIKDRPREVLLSLCLNHRNDVVGLEILSIGSVCASICSPAEVFKAALLTNSSGVILAHNHPSGRCEASTDDEQVAQSVARAARILDMKLLDFLVLTEDSFYSFARSRPELLELKEVNHE